MALVRGKIHIYPTYHVVCAFFETYFKLRCSQRHGVVYFKERSQVDIARPMNQSAVILELSQVLIHVKFMIQVVGKSFFYTFSSSQNGP